MENILGIDVVNMNFRNPLNGEKLNGIATFHDKTERDSEFLKLKSFFDKKYKFHRDFLGILEFRDNDDLIRLSSHGGDGKYQLSITISYCDN